MSAGAWATVTMFLWIIGFPSYVIKRSLRSGRSRTSLNGYERSTTGRLPRSGLVHVILCDTQRMADRAIFLT
jgi:hypothetical protein